MHSSIGACLESMAAFDGNAHGPEIVRRDGVPIEEGAHGFAGIRQLKPGHKARGRVERHDSRCRPRFDAGQRRQLAQRLGDEDSQPRDVLVCLWRQVDIGINRVVDIETGTDAVRSPQIPQEHEARGEHD